jgi:tripartite-type tricarboxylate transporter receptor subunit TctC
MRRDPAERRPSVGAALSEAAALPAAAQDAYPSRSIRFVVPFAACGPSGIVARIIAPRMAAGLGRPAIMDNRAGAPAI